MSGISPQTDHDACGVGFVAQLGGKPSHEMVERALEALLRLEHRGGVDADGRSGDGAGLLTAIPDAFLRAATQKLGIELPSRYAVGMVFIACGCEAEARSLFARLAEENALQMLGWRKVPTNSSIVGPRARDTLPCIEQCFLAPSDHLQDFEISLFRLRKQVEATAPRGTYVCSLSSRTLVYKGLVTPHQLPVFYPDLADESFASSFAIFHQRYSTNTQPSWSLAQPFRLIAHNGEINTISANRRWLLAKQAELLPQLNLPAEVNLLEPGVSDSASFDNALELMVRQDYTVGEGILAMVPPAWESAPYVAPELRRFLEEQAHYTEPWDGPAAMIFTDGYSLGAKLDRNGLRPLRYTLTSDGLLTAGSEVGIVDLQGKRIIERQRLGPGEMLLLNLETGELLRPQDSLEIRKAVRFGLPVSTHVFSPSAKAIVEEIADPKPIMAAQGWSEDQFKLLFLPLVEQGQESVWSMGDDTPPATISQLRRPLWDYCKQRFAQVTNPPIDPLREAHVMSLRMFLGEQRVLSSPLLDAGEIDALEAELGPPSRIDFTFPASEGITGAKAALQRIQQEAVTETQKEPGFMVLSDRAVDSTRASLPTLLAFAAVWKHVIQAGGWRIPVLIESGQVIDTHHVALLVAAGCSGVFPYLAMQQALSLRTDGAARYRMAIEKGLRKVIARMGISTIASYHNSQLFETVGLDPEVGAEFFENANRVLGGKSLDELLQDSVDRHAAAFKTAVGDGKSPLQDYGLYRFRHGGEQHSSSPELMRRMHRYLKTPSPENYRSYSELGKQREAVAIRDLMETVDASAVSLDEVEPDQAILSRFSTQAMSLGAISPETHQTLAIAMNRLGGRSNTGEGGEDPQVYEGKSLANNRVKQVASGRFGVTAQYLVHADELEIKIAQGAKPGEGGQLPASKVTVYIARLRHAIPGMMLISPPPHHDIYSIEDLAQLIYDLRAINPKARIGVKLVSSAGVGIIATGVAKAGADVITISGYDGGTGASPITSIKNTGIPWEVGLREAHAALSRTGLRRRVRLRVDGGFKFATDVIIGALLGADEFGFGTSALLAIGCVMARQCHLNTCPVGIATQDEKLRARFTGKPEMVETFLRGLVGEVRELLAAMGARSISEIVGDVARLRPRTEEAERVLAGLLDPVTVSTYRATPYQDDSSLHLELNRTVEAGSETFPPRPQRFKIVNSDRAIGAHLTGKVLRLRRKADASPQVPDYSGNYEFIGTAGQSFGAFLIQGLHFRLVGEANDYVGKGLCGGTIAISGGPEASLRGDVLAGNTLLYGATSGELFVAGRVGERCGVRNSGALAVVEGVGQHACEYMTAGIAIILGPAGMNLGAGMTGGLAYMLRDSVGGFGYNQQSVRLAQMEVREEIWLRTVLRRHLSLTESPRAAALLKSDEPLPFVRVEPVHLPCTVAQTWSPILSKFKRPGVPEPIFPAIVSYEEYAAV